MKVNELEGFLDIFLDSASDNNIYSVLIDGKAGIGKTYEITKYFEEKNNFIYISFFGIDKIEDVVYLLSEKIDSTYILNNNSKFLVANNNLSKWNNGVIIFDDLERKADEIKLSSIEGLINSLVRNGFKVLSIINSKFLIECNMSDKDEASKRKYLDELFSFFEKTFDRKIDVDVSNDSACSISKINDKLLIKSYLSLANDNLRILNRAREYYESINSFFIKKGKNNFLKDINSDYKKYFRCILAAVRCVFGTDYKEKEINTDDYFWRVKYEEFCENFRNQKNIANELFNLLKNNELVENGHLFEPFIVKLIQTYLTNDYNILYNDYYNITDVDDILNKAPFNDHIFYLSDEDNVKYKDLFVKNINKFDFSNDKHVSLLMDIAKYAVKSFTKSDLDKIIDRIMKTVQSDEKEELYSQLERFLIMRDETGNGQIQSVINEIKTRLDNNIEQNEFEKLNKEIGNKNYKYLIDYLYENRNTNANHKKDIEKIFEKNDYLLPDLSASINYTIWSYCHEIASFIVGDEEQIEKFINVLVKQYNLNSSSSTLMLKSSSLVMQYFNKKFEDYINKK